MSFQTSQDDTTFGPSGEKIFPSSTKGQIFIFENKIYSLYSEFINNQYSIIVYNITNNQKKTIYTSDKNPVIRALQVDATTGNIWFGGYLDEPMVGFFATFKIQPTPPKTELFTTITVPTVRTPTSPFGAPTNPFGGFSSPFGAPTNPFGTSTIQLLNSNALLQQSLPPAGTITSISSLDVQENMRTIETICIVNSTSIIYSGITKKNECVFMKNSSTNVYKINTTLTKFSVKDIYLNNKQYHVLIEGISSTTNKNAIEMYKIGNNILLGSV